jgi:hypothetical protein
MSDALTSWVLPLATAVLVTVLDVLLWRQWAARRKVHQLWWAVGFALYASAALMEMVALLSDGWNPAVFRVYAVTSAVLVPVLAQGTVALISHGKLWSRVYLAYNCVVVAVFAFGVFTTTLVPEELAKAALSSYAPLGGTALTYPRMLSMLLTIPAALILFWGAVLSVFRFMRKKEYAYRMWANVLIAAATLVIASGGGLAKAGNTSMFYLIEMVAAVLYFAGFVMASSLQKGAENVRKNRSQEA